MVTVDYHPKFKKQIVKIKDITLKTKLKKQVIKIISNPEIGKPMKNVRKGTREVRVKHYRLSYSYIEKEKKIIILSLYHKDVQ
jgi:mRNA-degrading endonuclease RelE of RelBE toxin-antitoxin system